MSRLSLGQVTVELWDEGRGEPVLLLHGFPTTNLLWQKVVPPLVEAGCRTLAPDLVGFGRSDAPDGTEIHMANQARWMLSLLDVVGVERAWLVAHDIGSAAAQIMVATAPERFRGLVIIDGVFGDRWGMEAVESIRSFDPASAASLFRLLVRRIRRQWTKTDVSEELIRQMLAPYEGHEGGARLIRAAQSMDPRQTVAILEDLRRNRVPSRVLWGDGDEFLSVDAVARPLADLLAAELKILPGGHFLPLERPVEIVAEITALLRL